MLTIKFHWPKALWSFALDNCITCNSQFKPSCCRWNLWSIKVSITTSSLFQTWLEVEAYQLIAAYVSLCGLDNRQKDHFIDSPICVYRRLLSYQETSMDMVKVVQKILVTNIGFMVLESGIRKGKRFLSFMQTWTWQGRKRFK